MTEQDITKLHKCGHTVNTVIIYNVMDNIRQVPMSVKDREVARVWFPKIGQIWRFNGHSRALMSTFYIELPSGKPT